MNWFEIAMQLRPVLLVLMVAIFAAVGLWAYAPRRKERFDDCARIPLRDDPLRDDM